MARIILVVFCGALVFVLVSKVAPRFIETYMTAPKTEEVTAEPEASGTKTRQGKKPATSVKTKSAQSASLSATPARAKTEIAAPAAKGAFATATAAGPGAAQPVDDSSLESVLRVNTDNATVYSTNNYVGPVVGLLKKGVVVEPLFTLSSAGQDWTFVNARQEKLAGFMLNDNLAKTKSTDQAKR